MRHWCIFIILWRTSACDCIDNAMNVMDPSKFDKDLQKECEDYAEGLSDDDKKERAKEMLGCLKDK